MRRGETRRVCGAEGRFKMNMKGRVRLNWIVRSSSTSLCLSIPDPETWFRRPTGVLLMRPGQPSYANETSCKAKER